MSGRPDLSLAQLHAFAAVAEELHFGRAAARLNMAQPALSQQIRRLEAGLDCRLFARDTRNVALTDAGRALLEVARRMLGDAAEGVDRVRRIEAGAAGLLTIGFTATTALTVLPVLVKAHRLRFPRIELQLIELLPEPLVEQLRSRHVDLALAREMFPDAEIATLTLLPEPFVAVLPSGHDLARGNAPVDAADLRDEPFILFPHDRVSGSNARVLDICAEAGFSPRRAQEAPGWHTAVSLVGTGLGVSILPACVASLALDGVAFRPLASHHRSTVMLLSRKADDRAAISHFLETAKTCRFS